MHSSQSLSLQPSELAVLFAAYDAVWSRLPHKTEEAAAALSEGIMCAVRAGEKSQCALERSGERRARALDRV